MLHGHSQYGELVTFAVHSAAHRQHRGELHDIRVHLVPPSLLDLAVILSINRNMRMFKHIDFNMKSMLNGINVHGKI